jgi:transposase
MVLREDKIGQSFLVPLELTELIPKNHICYFIEDMVNELDFRKLEKKNIDIVQVNLLIHDVCLCK